MSAIEDLSEVSLRAARAEAIARSVRWRDQDAVGRIEAQISATLAVERKMLLSPELLMVVPSPRWQRRLQVLTEPEPSDNGKVDDLAAAAAQAEADATAAVAVARIALGEGYQAVLRARLAVLAAGDTEAVAARTQGYRLAPASPHPALRHVHDLGQGCATS